MKNLGRTIDQLIKIEPGLEEKLSQIKNKWKRFPAKTLAYWKELIEYLNSDPSLLTHPKRMEMRNIIVSKKRSQRKVLSSFDKATSSDIIVGVIPEHISDDICRQDRLAIEYAKMHLEANMTKNVDLLAEINRKELLLEIATKKVWVALKDHFGLWNKPISHTIKKRDDGLLVLVEFSTSSFMGSNLVKMDLNTMRNFFKFLGIDPPQGLPDDDPPQ
jgi:hypothetical protein